MLVGICIGLGISLFLIVMAFAIVGLSKSNPIDVKDSDDAQMDYIRNHNKKYKSYEGFGKDR